MNVNGQEQCITLFHLNRLSFNSTANSTKTRVPKQLSSTNNATLMGLKKHIKTALRDNPFVGCLSLVFPSSNDMDIL